MNNSANILPLMNHKTRSQRGMATLYMTIILLSAVGLIGLYTNRTAITEQRLSANEIRSKQAFAAANAGLDHALAYMRSGGIDQDKNSVVDTITSNTLTQNSGQAAYYQAAFCDRAPGFNNTNCPATHTGTLSCTPPTELANMSIVSCGWSDDDSSVQRVVQAGGTTPSLGGTVSTPLTSRGTANLLTGGASILNYFNDLTVWSGGTLLGQSNTGKTFIRNIATNPVADPTADYRNVGTSPTCNNPPSGYQCSTQGSTLGHDTVGGDTNLSNLSPDGFFQYFMGQAPTPYRDNVATWIVDTTGSLTSSNSTSVNSIIDRQDDTIWVEGDMTVPGDIGTQDHPVVLVVNGNLNLGSNSTINGLVYVSGTISGNGSPTIYGALVGAGTANATGNLKVVFDPNVLGKAANLGKPALLQGSWRDW